MCACDTKQAQGFPAHHNKAQPLDRAMTDQSINTTSPGPAVPQHTVLPPTPWEPFSAPAPGSSAGAQSTSIPPRTLQVLPTHWSGGLFSSHPSHAGVKAIPRAVPHQHTLGAQSTAGNAGAASAGPDLCVVREKIPSRAGRGAQALYGEGNEGQEGTREIPVLLGRGWVWGWGCRRWERAAKREHQVCNVVQGLR